MVHTIFGKKGPSKLKNVTPSLISTQYIYFKYVVLILQKK